MISPFQLLRVLGVVGFACVTFLVVKPASAATSTVCAAGCDFTSVSLAAASSTSGDVFAVGASYVTADEVFPISSLANKTIDCQSSGATIGNVSPTGDNRIVLSTNTVVRNCSFGNISLYSNFFNPDGIQILNNTFSTTVTSTIQYDGGMDDFTISNNRNIGAFYSLSAPTSVNTGLIENNTFYIKDNTGGYPFDFTTEVRNVRVLSNTFTSWLTAANSASIVQLRGHDITFATNTIQYGVTPPNLIGKSVEVRVSGTTYFGGNKIESPPQLVSCVGTSFLSPNTSTVNWRVVHNTVKISGNCTSGTGYYFTDSAELNPNITIDFNYNAVYGSNLSSATNTTAVILNWEEPAHAFVFNNTYNGFYGLVNGLSISFTTTSLALAANTLTSNPFLRLGNVSTADDFDPAPFSPYLDVNGTLDVGAVSGVRNSTIAIDQSGTIDYSTVHATSTVGIGDIMRSGDTLQLSAGTYAPITVSSTQATTTIAITGVESGVIIDGNLDTVKNGIRFSNVTSSSITNVAIRNASSTELGTYLIDLVSGVYGGVSYAEAAGDMGVAASSTSILIISDAGLPYYTTNDYEITNYVRSQFTDWHVALFDLGAGQRITTLVPGYVASSAQAIQGDIGFLPVAFATSTFIYNAVSGTYTFDQTALDAAGITLASWVSATPQLTFVPGIRLSGIRLDQAYGITLTSVTSTSNGNGISIGTGSSTVTVSDSSFSGNTHYDLNHEADVRSTFDNVSFTRTSSTFTGAGDLLVKFDTRVRTTISGAGTALQNVQVTSTDASLSETALGVTDASGYTSYVSLPAYVMSDGLISVTNGGFNSYTFAAATSTYTTSSTSQSVISPNTTVSIAMVAVVTAPNAPTSAAAASVSTSTVTLGWTDNASNEDSFRVEYRRPLHGEAYPGTATSVSGVASVDITGLIPGEQYEFRVAAVNTAATSSHATSTVFTMGAISAAPTLSALSGTSFSAVIDTNENATSVSYALYSSSLSGYLDSLGAVTTTAVWQTSSTWSTLTVGSLTCGTTYSVATIARNSALTESATSTAATVTTSACATVSSSGGGGGGGSSGGSSGGIQTFFNQAPVATTPVSNPVITPPVTTQPDQAPSPVTPITPAPVVSLQDFIQFGTTPATKALGSGERAALLRDARETMGRMDIPVEDLERMAEGQIPKTRNLAIERTMVPRALATFRSMFGHVPNFKNASENLAWNTLMYRIRFPRDLKKEAEGIREFRALFGKNPSDPFQWSVVRVLGYIQ